MESGRPQQWGPREAGATLGVRSDSRVDKLYLCDLGTLLDFSESSFLLHSGANNNLVLNVFM
jgi:hypothetical protein